MRRILSNVLAVIWFFGVLVELLLFNALSILILVFDRIVGTIQTGYGTSPSGFVVCFLAGTLLAITGWVPAFRKCYYKLPWLYPLSMIMTMHLVIISIAEAILLKGFLVVNASRHLSAVIIMVIQLIVCRAAMCIYLKKYPMVSQQTALFTRRIKRGAAVLLAMAFVSVISISIGGGGVETGPDVEEAIETHMSATLAIGTRLMESDDHYIGGDITIAHSSNMEKTRIWVWDYADEDGDYVQIIVDETPMGEPFMLRNKPVSFIVPAEGEVQILGAWDGGDGITYAVYYELNQTTYFNGMRQGGSHRYTLVREALDSD